MSKRHQMLGAYMSSVATGSATTTATGYDAQAVVGLERASRWLASGTSAGRLILNHGTTVTPTGLAIEGGNFASWGTTKLQHSADGSSWTDFLTLSSLPADGLDYFAALTSAPAKQYWCLYWAAPSAAPQVGIFYLGTLTEFAQNPEAPQEGEDVYNVPEERASSGAIITEQYGRRTERIVIEMTNLSTATFAALRTLLRAEGGNLRPFWYVPRDDSGSGDAGQAFLVRMSSSLKWREVWTGYWDVSFVLREEA